MKRKRRRNDTQEREIEDTYCNVADCRDNNYKRPLFYAVLYAMRFLPRAKPKRQCRQVHVVGAAACAAVRKRGVDRQRKTHADASQVEREKEILARSQRTPTIIRPNESLGYIFSEHERPTTSERVDHHKLDVAENGI
jgi:hypothetical protein